MMPDQLPCGGRTVQDPDSEWAHVCQDCLTVVGSISMPQECRRLLERQQTMKRLKGEGV